MKGGKYWNYDFHTVMLTCQCPISLTQVTCIVYRKTDECIIVSSFKKKTSGFHVDCVKGGLSSYVTNSQVIEVIDRTNKGSQNS